MRVMKRRGIHEQEFAENIANTQAHSKASLPPTHPAMKTGFDYPATLVGQTKWTGSDGGPVSVYFDPSTGSIGENVALNILSRLDDLMNYCDTIFGVKGKSGNVIIAPDFGGAYHASCGFNEDGGGSDWYESLSGNDTTFGLVMAEVCESYMGLQGRGWNCGGSGGEGLSRFLAEVVTGGAGGAMKDYAAGPSWDGKDWVSRDQGTDQDYPSTGCAVLYCWYMMKTGGLSVVEFVQAGESDGTLASNYALLTGKPKNQAFVDLKAAVMALGGLGTFNDDNPFKAANPPYPIGPPPQPPTCPAGQHWDPVTQACVPDGGGNPPTGNVLILTAAMPAGTYPVGLLAPPAPAGNLTPAQIAALNLAVSTLSGMLADQESDMGGKVVMKLRAAGVPWKNIFQWIVKNLPQLLSLATTIFSGGFSKLTPQQIITWITAAIAAIMAGQPLPPLPAPATTGV